jgi:putative methyltransferase (TIGR04325 family)
LKKLKYLINKILKDITPPVIFKAFLKKNRGGGYGFFGKYKNWNDAVKECSGYDSDMILEKVKESSLKVRNGEAVFERDSYIFDKIQYSWPLLAGIMKAAADSDGRLSVLDFGGALGSHYFQNREFFKDLKEFKWSVVEQKNFVDCGKELFEDDKLKFYYDIDSCTENENPNVIVLSSVIQYMEKPYDLIRDIVNRGIEYIVIDRTAFNVEDVDLLTVQKVPPFIYDASYPAWFLNEKKFLSAFENKYKLVADFEASDVVNIPSIFKGFLFQRV